MGYREQAARKLRDEEPNEARQTKSEIRGLLAPLRERERERQ